MNFTFRVVDKDTQAGIPNATILTGVPVTGKDYPVTAMADVSGLVNIDLPSADYVVNISSVGYQRIITTVSKVSGLAVGLTKNYEDLPPVTVTPTDPKSGVKKTAIYTAAVIAAVLAAHHFKLIKF